jgi:hypothetical protein
VGGEVQRDGAATVAEGRSGDPLVSVCIIARNEEPHLGRCLASFDGLADELNVVGDLEMKGSVAGDTVKFDNLALDWGPGASMTYPTVAIRAGQGKWGGVEFENVGGGALKGSADLYFITGIAIAPTAAEASKSGPDSLAYIARVCYWEPESSSWIAFGRLRVAGPKPGEKPTQEMMCLPLKRFDGMLIPTRFRLDAERIAIKESPASPEEDVTSSGASDEVAWLRFVDPRLVVLV